MEVIALKGRVRFFSDYRGFGFAVGQDGQEYFVHVSQLKFDGHKTLSEGQDISFTTTRTRKGLQALDVHLIEKRDGPKGPLSLNLKKNPFTPQDPVISTQKFSGRRDAVANAVDALYNNKNVLVLGPRGIGKTSLTYQLMYMVQGETELLDKVGIELGGYVFDHLTGDHRCVPGNSLGDVCNGLLSTLCTRINTSIKDKTRSIRFDVDFKLIKFSTETTSVDVSPTDLSLQFVSQIETLLDKHAHLGKSVSFVIDEIDVLDTEIGIAPFLRATSEKFKLNNKVNVSFIVSGITGSITDLITQHQSVSRLFENISLPRMEKWELEGIIDSALQDTDVSISQNAKDEIVKLSNQFPQPVHLLGYHAFRIDSNRKIETNDVEQAKEAVVSEIKRQDFESRFDSIATGAMTEVIRAMSSAVQETGNLNFLRVRLKHMSDRQIIGTIGRLMEMGILEKQHRDVYRFCDPLFKIYLRWLFGIH